MFRFLYKAIFRLQLKRLFYIQLAVSLKYEISFILEYRGADKSLARPGRKQATATEDIDVHISYL